MSTPEGALTTCPLGQPLAPNPQIGQLGDAVEVGVVVQHAKLVTIGQRADEQVDGAVSSVLDL